MLITLILFITNILNRIGKSTSWDASFRRLLYTIVDREELIIVRDEALEIVRPRVFEVKSLDRWGLERQIDRSRSKAIDDLRKGERSIAIAGGIFAILITNLFGWVFGGLVVSITILFFTLTVAFRVVVVDILAYSSANTQYADLIELLKMKGWNNGPLRSYGAMGVVVVAIFTSTTGAKSSEYLDSGMQMADSITFGFIESNEDRWTAEGD